MKSNSILLIFYTLFLLNTAVGQKTAITIVQGDTINLAKDTVVRNKLINLNLLQFEGKTVAELLKNDTAKLYKRHWFSEEPPLKLRSLNLTFARGLYLTIYFAELKYQSRFSKTGQYSFNKILRETISKIELDKNFFEENVVKKYSKPD
jgi:pSer/pThr/pTyr-binding forkhead associated (FHA) protein